MKYTKVILSIGLGYLVFPILTVSLVVLLNSLDIFKGIFSILSVIVTILLLGAVMLGTSMETLGLSSMTQSLEDDLTTYPLINGSLLSVVLGLLVVYFKMPTRHSVIVAVVIAFFVGLLVISIKQFITTCREYKKYTLISAEYKKYSSASKNITAYIASHNRKGSIYLPTVTIDNFSDNYILKFNVLNEIIAKKAHQKTITILNQPDSKAALIIDWDLLSKYIDQHSSIFREYSTKLKEIEGQQEVLESLKQENNAASSRKFISDMEKD